MLKNSVVLKKINLFLLFIALPSIALAEKSADVNYEMISTVEYTGSLDEYIIRYFTIFDSESPYCLGYLDSLAYKDKNAKYPSGRTLYQTKPLCHLYGREVGSGYTDAHVEKVEFEKGLVRLFISYTYLRGPYGEFKTECTVKVSDGEFGDLVCEEEGRRAVEE